MTIKNEASRRSFLVGSSSVLGACVVGSGLIGCSNSKASPNNDGGRTPDDNDPLNNPFRHGVATGDPLPDRVIFWTRVTQSAMEDVLVTLRVYQAVTSDGVLSGPVLTAPALATAEKDFTVKIDGGLPASYSTFYYQFECELDGKKYLSPIGRTKTAPASNAVPSDGRLRFALVSCSNYAHGYFNAYRQLARRKDLDFVLHLGDYIYEYADGHYGTVRGSEPPHEMVTLDDYRTRFAYYRLDQDLAELHRQYAFINTWDDHEIADNTYRCDATNHTSPEENPSDNEGLWSERWPQAVRAYNEWLPIRVDDPSQPEKIYRGFSFGALMDMHVADTRFIGRDMQPSSPVDVGGMGGDIGSTEVDCDIETGSDDANPHNLMGPAQRDWLENRMRRSTTTWQFLAQQIMVGQLYILNLDNATPLPVNVDQWDGYPKARDWFWGLLEELRASDNEGKGRVVVLTGDIHSSWANDIARKPGGVLGLLDGNTVSAVLATLNTNLSKIPLLGPLLGGVLNGVDDVLNVVVDPVDTLLDAVEAVGGNDRYDPETGFNSLGVEYVCTSITSPGIEALDGLKDLLTLQNRHQKYIDLTHQGYMIMDVENDHVQGQWWYVGGQAEVATANDIHVAGPAFRGVHNASGELYLQQGGVQASEWKQPRIGPLVPELAP